MDNHDPDCVQCRETMDFLKHSPGYGEIWRLYKDSLPPGWISATDDAVVKTELLYDLKAMPTLYLLDSAHRVVLKDASPAAVLQAVAGLS